VTELQGANYEATKQQIGLLHEWILRGWKGSVFYTLENLQYGLTRMLASVLESLHEESRAVMIPSREPVELSFVRELIEKTKGT
ncbi:MAG: hypothetical protein VX255_07565, partial [Candidatus Latescibacterota bacterium]|nr:hypothetical protein [Candidatus Latescibacterota bacterium]